MMKILLTGANGFIGSHLLERLVESYDVSIIKRKNSNLSRLRKIEGYKSFNLDEQSLNEIFESNFDMVVHLATHYRKEHKKEDIEEMIRTNITFPTLLLENMVERNVKYFINTGTFFEYDLSEEALNEDSPISPYNLYAATKAGFLENLKFFSRDHKIKVIDLKLFSPYGPRDNQKFIPYLIKCLLKDVEAHVSLGEQQLDLTYVGDIVDAYKKSIDYITRMDLGFQSFNIGKGHPESIRRVVELLEDISGKRGLINMDRDYGERDIFFSCADNSRSRRILGWEPKITLEEGLKLTYGDYQNGI